MIVLALDLGTNCGWARGSGLTLIDSGTLRLKHGRHEHPGARWERLRRDLIRLMTGCDLIVYERVRRHEGVQAAHCYGALKGAMESVAYSLGKDVRSLEVAHIKRHATGKGNATKHAMLAAAVRRGWNPTTFDQADALWILDLAMLQESAP